MKNTRATNVDEYIASFPDDVRKKLEEMRAAIRKAAPKAEETISYAIPTFKLNGNLVHFAAFGNHIGFYPTPGGIKAFKEELSLYDGGKGTVRFPLDKRLPIGLISKIVKFRVKDNLQKSTGRKARSKTQDMR